MECRVIEQQETIRSLMPFDAHILICFLFDLFRHVITAHSEYKFWPWSWNIMKDFHNVLLDSDFIQTTCRNRKDWRRPTNDIYTNRNVAVHKLLCQARFSFLLISQTYLVFCSCFHVTWLVHQSSYEIRIFMKQVTKGYLKRTGIFTDTRFV
jgi:hypothetical protein